jgi:serine protease Do
MLNTTPLPRRASTLAAGVFAALLLTCTVCLEPLAAAQLWKEGSGVEFEQPQVPSFIEAAKVLKPAVVNISSRRTAPTEQRSRRRRPFPFGGEDPFREFFDRFFGEQRRPRHRPSLGTGFIINTNGYIVTNNHVVEEAGEITVTLASKEEFEATLIGRDPKTDLALLRVDSSLPLPTVPFGDSENLEVGEWVLAIGNPFGLGHTVTAGIVSAKGRTIGAGPYDDFIQTDASINPGNSGGPLFNMRGEVIGINTAIMRSGQGIGFAIPINMAKNVLSQLYDKGNVTRGWLGVAIQSISPEMLNAFKLDDANGALVSGIVTDAPADKAGLQQGDVIVGFHGSEVEDSSVLPGLVAVVAPGTTVDVEIIRDGQRMTIPVTLGELEEDEAARIASLEPSGVEELLGIQVEAITEDMARELRTDDDRGVVVTDVADESPAANAGIQPGDIVREVNRQTVEGLDAYEAATAQIEDGETVLLLLERRGNHLYVALRPERN